MASGLEDKLGEIYVQISADVKGLEKDIRELKARMERDSGKPKIDFVNVLAKKKISELEVMQKKLKAKLEEKIKMNVDLASLNRTREMLNAVTRELEGVKGETVKASGGFKEMFMTGMKTAGAWLGVTAALDLGRRIIQTASEFEQLRTRLVSLYGDTKKAGQVFEYLKDVASTTPYSLKGIVEAGAQLKAFGMDTEAMIKPVADLAAYMGMDVVEAANAMGRAFSGGAGAADILRERGVLNLVKDFKKIDDLTALTLPEFRKALQETLVDPAAGIVGSTDRMSKTFSGAMSNMMDSVENLAAAIGGKLLAVLSPLVKFIGGVADTVKELISPTKSAIANFNTLSQTFLRLVKTNERTASQNKALEQTMKELDSQYGTNLTSIIKQKGAYSELADEINRARVMLIEKAKVEAIAATQKEKLSKAVENEQELIELEYKLTDAKAKVEDMRKKGYDQADIGTEKAKQYGQAQIEAREIQDTIYDLNEENKVLQKENEQLESKLDVLFGTKQVPPKPPDDIINTREKLDNKIKELESKLQKAVIDSKEEKEIKSELQRLTIRYEKISKIYHFKDSSTSRTSQLKQELELVEELGKGLAEWHRVSVELIRAETDEMIKSGVKKEDALALQKKKMEELELRYKKLAEAAARMVPIRITEPAQVRMDSESLAKLEGRIGDLRTRLQDIESGSKSSAGEVAELKRELAELLSLLDRERQKGNFPRTTLAALPFPNEKTYQENNFRDPTQMELWEEWMNQSQAAGEAFDTFVDVAMRGLDELRIRAAEDASAMEKMFVDMSNIIIQKIQEIIAAWAIMNLFSWIGGGPGVGLLSVLGIGGGTAGGVGSGAVGGAVTGVPVIPGFAAGGSFTVPPGFTHDSYPILVQSGERVNVTAANKVTDQEKMINILANKLDILTYNVIENGMQQMRQPTTQSVQVYGKFDGHQLYLATKKAERFNRRYR